MPNTRKRSRQSKNFVAIPFDSVLPLLAVADQTVVKGALTGNLLEDLFAISVDMSGTLTGLTSGEGDPIEMGLAHSDYTVTEIKENLDVQYLGPGTKVEQEQARRLVRRVGTSVFSANVLTSAHIEGRGGSRIIRSKLKFLVSSGFSLNFWAKNRSGSTLTTGANLRVAGTIYGRWIV